MSPLLPLASARPQRRAIRQIDTLRATDPELLSAVRAGCSASFGELYRRHEDAVRLAARRMVWGAPTGDADDLTAEAFTRLLATLRRGNGPKDNPVAYLVVVMRNHQITGFHQEARSRSLVERLVLERSTAAEAPEPEHEAEPELTSAMHTLNGRHRRVLWWTEVEGRQPQEVAAALGITTGAAAALSYRARRALDGAYDAERRAGAA